MTESTIGVPWREKDWCIRERGAEAYRASSKGHEHVLKLMIKMNALKTMEFCAISERIEWHLNGFSV